MSRKGGHDMPRIYVSPSSQEHNAGIGSFGTEEAEMNKIADSLMPLLVSDGRFVVKRNTPNMDVNEMAVDSNNFKADIHVAIHSNAGGGAGTEVYSYGPATNSERLAQALYKQVAPLSPGADRGVKYNPSLVEVGDNVSATSALIELGFHDNTLDAEWIVQSTSVIAAALYRGICDYYGYDYRALAGGVPTVVPAEDRDIYLSVRVRQSKSVALISKIQVMGYACKVLPLA
jgi:N-acetylmuramoyl-L-alanine amidase